ncbi:hypothetical protein [Rhodococcus phage REQ1]|uniref:hypothetical protein n=1 Tax=Rhodococcus phage REQ1 TaxID=1109712 RepID=UPI00023EEC4C|nr:hypothetical protein RoPhREQ1_gp42 [Rhodococcus phage REQ1]AEV52038.1 hypothetical protein [Rhodococcus phage REQ1]
MAGKVIRRLVVEIDEEANVTIDGYGWATVDPGENEGETTLWLGGDVPTIVILARQDQLDAPQVVADEVWSLERLEQILMTTAHLARGVAIDPSELDEGDEYAYGDED